MNRASTRLSFSIFTFQFSILNSQFFVLRFLFVSGRIKGGLFCNASKMQWYICRSVTSVMVVTLFPASFEEAPQW